VQASPPITARDLQELLLGPGVPSEALDMASEFPHLQVLKVHTGDPFERLNMNPFIGIFRACHELREVRLSGATTVTNEMLACIMTHTPNLALFHGSRYNSVVGRPSVMFPFQGGPRQLEGGGLNEEALAAFRHRFPEADITLDMPNRVTRFLYNLRGMIST